MNPKELFKKIRTHANRYTIRIIARLIYWGIYKPSDRACDDVIINSAWILASAYQADKGNVTMVTINELKDFLLQNKP